MPPFFEQILNQDGRLIQGCFVLFSAFILAKFVPLTPQFQPIVWFKQLAIVLSDKVNHPSRSISQQVTAGILATLLLTLPFGFIVFFVLELAAFPWFFDIIIVYLCITDTNFTKTAQQIITAIKQQNNPKAKLLLAPWVKQKTSQLSEVGLSKTTIEKLLTQPIYSILATIMFYIIGGAPLVVLGRLLKQLELCWPPYHPHFYHFASFVFHINKVLFFIPTLLWHFSLAVQYGYIGISTIVTKTANRQQNHQHGTVLLGAKLLSIELGGPQQFDHNQQVMKVSLSKVNQGQLPLVDHIQQAISLTRNASLFWIGFCFFTPVIWTSLRWLQTM